MGYSNSLRIPKAFLETVFMKENDRVEIIAENDTITIRKATRQYKNLDELFAGFTGLHTYIDVSRTAPHGNETI